MYAYFLYVFLAFFVPLFDLVYGATGFVNIVQVVTTTILYLTFKAFLAFNRPFEICVGTCFLVIEKNFLKRDRK